MTNVLFDTITNTERPGWRVHCPECKEDVRYTVLNVNGGREPFLYCSLCSNFVVRQEDADLVAKLAGQNAYPSLDQLRRVYIDLEQHLPPCPCGGHFRIWANVKCANCHTEVPYNNGIKNDEVRFFESKIVWSEGAAAFRGANVNSSYLIKVTLT